MTYYTTGMPDLDDQLGGGLPAGTVAVLEVPAASAGALVPPTVASVVERPTVYVTTDRSPDQITRDIAAAVDDDRPDAAPTDHVAVTEFTGDDGLGTHGPPADPTGETPRDDDAAGAADPHAAAAAEAEPAPGETVESSSGAVDEALPTVPTAVSDLLAEIEDISAAATDVEEQQEPAAGPFCFVFDHFTPLVARDDQQWRQVYDRIHEQVREVEGIAVLVMLRSDDRSLATDRVFHRADAVLQYQTGGLEESDRLVVRRVSGLSDDCTGLPISLELAVADTVSEDPDTTFQ